MTGMTVTSQKRISFYLSTFGIIFIVCFCKTGAADKPEHDKKVVCYYSSWATYRNPYPFTPKQIDPSLCTHIIYSYGALQENSQDSLVSNTPHTDLKTNFGLGYYQEVTSLKDQYPHLKVLLCLGGWNQGSENFSKLARSVSKRSAFVSSAVAYLREYNFDGLDIFWQYPAQRGGLASDKENFVILLKELKDEFKKHNYLLTVYLSPSQYTIDSGYDLPSIGQVVDWVNLYGHGLNTPWDGKFGVSSPLNSKDGNNVKEKTSYFLNHGVPNNKLVLILSSMGFGYINTDKPGKVDGLPGLYGQDKGFLTYHEICRYLSNSTSGWTETWDNLTSTPIAVKGNNRISYDNQESLKLKVKYADEVNLAGVGLWSIDTDDFLGLCSLPGGYGNQENQSKFPLLKAIHQEFDRLIQRKVDPMPNIKVTVITHEYK